MSEYYLKLELFFPSETHAKSIFLSLQPEHLQEKKDRSRVKMQINKSILSIDIKAKDATALKASINSYLKSIILCNKILEEE